MKNFPVPGHENEKMIIFARRSWWAVLGTTILVGVMFFVPLIILIAVFILNHTIFSGFTLNFIIIGVSIYYLVAADFAFIEWISYYCDIFIVTDRGIIDICQEGLFDRRITEVSLLRIQDVSAEIKGFLSTFFGYGNVMAESAGENTRTYIIDNIPHPMEIANKIMELHNAAVAREERAGEMGTGEGDLRPHSRGIPGKFQEAIQKDLGESQSRFMNELSSKLPIMPDNNSGPDLEPKLEPTSTPTVPTVSEPVEEAPTKPLPICEFPPASTENKDQPPSVQPPVLQETQPKDQLTQGEIKKDDLDQGGEITF